MNSRFVMAIGAYIMAGAITVHDGTTGFVVMWIVIGIVTALSGD